MKAGALNRRVALFAPLSAINALGETVDTWEHLADIWASRGSLSLRDATRMAGLANSAEAKFAIRYRPNVTNALQVECEGVRYAITAVEEIGFRVGLTIFARAI